MLSPTIFREYDIRGVADRDLPSEGIRLLGQAIGTYIQRNAGPKVCVGRDVRLSGGRLRDAIVEGLRSSGCAVTDTGVLPTPLLYYSVFHLHTDGAVMITGSHNPPEHNGFKVVSGKSTLYGQTIQELRKMIESGDLAKGEGKVQSADVIDPYVEEIGSKFNWTRRIKVVVDNGNGVAGPTLRKLLAKLNCDAIELFFEPDGTFPGHHPDPTIDKNLVDLQNAVREHKADLGVGFDGDADRIGAVDENGGIVRGDMLLLIYAREILIRKPGAKFIGEVKCSQVMYDELERLGGHPIMYRTGHSLIKAKLKEEHAELAGEMSGHMFFADGYYGFDDALYAACRLMKIVADSGEPLSAQLRGIPKMANTPEGKVECPDTLKFEVVRRFAEKFKATHKVIDVDGARVLFSGGWGLVRASNTEPKIVTRFEAVDEATLAQIQNEVNGALQEILKATGV